jgi:hypothetical protein
MPYLSGCDLAKKIATEINTAITIIIITAANDIEINPLKLQVYFKPILMSKLSDIVKKIFLACNFHKILGYYPYKYYFIIVHLTFLLNLIEKIFYIIIIMLNIKIKFKYYNILMVILVWHPKL